MPGLDGLRAVAVLAVVGYHVGLGAIPGGLLGVGVFFTLSGYLITDLILARWATGARGLGDFWVRRARRLLPALFVMLVVVGIWVSVADRAQLAEVRGQSIAAAFYVGNWWQIAQHVSYFARFGPPSPLNHLWSLAVEEQFYLLWPWLLLLGARYISEPRRATGVRPRLACVTLALAVISAIEMAVLYHPSFDASRVYDGTDTRAFGLLFGAALAMVWPSRLLTRPINASARRTLDRLGAAGLLVIALLYLRANEYSSFLYRGGMVLLSLATVLVIAAAAHPATRVGRALAAKPLRWVGERSYGIYLWHVPVIVLTSPVTGTPDSFPRAVLQVAASIGLAALSWRYIEQPIRRGEFQAMLTHARLVGWRALGLPLHARAALAGALGAVAFACAGLSGMGPSGDVSGASAAIRDTDRASTVTTATRSRRPPVGGTSCRAVAHIGDSTSVGLVSSVDLPDPHQRIGAQYARIGATRQHLEIEGGTSVVETLPGGTNAYEVAQRLVKGGFRGCWVLALGTNDTADVYVGSSTSVSERIARMMSVIGNQPVMWVNVKSLRDSGPYSEDNMSAWNAALFRACQGHPNMRIFDWASAVHDDWYATDEIHYNPEGYRQRSRLIADALAKAFPARGGAPRSNCLVSIA